MAKASCTAGDCHRPAEVRSWCNRHYLRWKRYGDPLGSARAQIRAEQEALSNWPEGERWVSLPSNSRYEVSDAGRIRHSETWVVKRCPVSSRGGYPVAQLWTERGNLSRTIHALVMEAFVGPRPDGAEIRHLNGDPTDNRLSNLMYGTRSENVADAVRHGTHHQASKTHCKRGHQLAGDNLVSDSRQRRCRTCTRASSAASQRRRREKKKRGDG